MYANPHDVDLEGKSCVAGRLLNFDVRDEYAFDIDETVQLKLDFYKDTTKSRVRLTYDRNEGAPAFNSNLFVNDELVQSIELPTTHLGFWRVTVPLIRARFANGGFAGTDFTLSGEREIVVCNIEISRSYSTPSPTNFGTATINVFDETGKRTAARMGIYDHSGRLPLPSEGAVLIRSFNSTSRVVPMRPGSTSWPSKNLSVFYVDGSYTSKLPAGDYDVIVSKGPEYRIARKALTILGGKTQKLNVSLTRWAHMAANRWYSGDVHIHYTRDGTEDDRNLLRFIEAEDLNLGNVLQMGNSGAVYFNQYSWRTISDESTGRFALVPGQEDPRNSRNGHTIHLNIREPVRNSTLYPLFHEVFERTRAQGGTTGYAHVWADSANSPRAGLALDVPFGLVDFVEILQWGNANPSIWFDFLNLGYRLSPAAGTDYPYADVPGAVRNYVYIENDFSPPAWFDGLRRGRTFVTNGPLLGFTVNGHAMGSDVQVNRGASLRIEGSAILNPDIDLLDRLELIEQGEIIKTVSSSGGSTKLTLLHRMSATHGTWFVVRAYGKRSGEHESILALTAPVYVFVDGNLFWKPNIVPSVVERLKTSLQAMLNDSQENEENWDTREPNTRHWEVQRWLLKSRIDTASTLYDELSKRATVTSSHFC